jgi:hypothetical protein
MQRMTPRSFALKTFAAIAMIASCAVWAVAAPAGAHTQPVGGCPTGGDIVNELDEVEITFAAPLLDDGSARIDLLGDNGERAVSMGDVVFAEDPATISAAVLGEVAPGFYIVRVTATTADGDLNGADTGFQFQFDPEATPDSDTCELSTGGGAGGWVLLGMGGVAVGALLFFLRPGSKSTLAA